MDELDSDVYYGYKESMRKAIKNISEDNLLWGQMPVILVDFHRWEVFYYENDLKAEDEIQNSHGVDWEEPPDGDDEDLIIFKFCTEREKTELKYTHKNYKFYKEVNDKKIYRERTLVNFEPELIINVSV